MANCYFITCHRALDHVSDLFRYIYRPEHLYIFHCDPKAPYAVRQFVDRLDARFPNVIGLPGQPYSWGGYSMVTTTLLAMRTALAALVPWNHFFWLSEQHLPLFGQDDTRWVLPSGWSFSDACRVAPMYPAGRADVLHRFSLDFRELPGVGAFGVAPRTEDPAFLADLYHGSNWLALDRGACVALLERAETPETAAPFSRAAQPDETMLQTLLFAGELAGRHHVRPWNPTYVAWPHLCGNPDMYCTLENMAAARDEGRLFIRKRPVVLPPEMRENMEAMAGFSADALLAELGPGVAEAQVGIGLPERLSRHVAADLAGLEYTLRLFNPATLANVPAFYMTITPKSPPPENLRGLRLCLLSEDLCNFKVLIAMHPPQDAGWSIVTVRGRHAYPLRVRVYDLFLEREVVIADEADGGFVTLAANGDLTPLDQTIHRYLEHMEALAAAGQA